MAGPAIYDAGAWRSRRPLTRAPTKDEARAIHDLIRATRVAAMQTVAELEAGRKGKPAEHTWPRGDERYEELRREWTER